MRGWRLFSHRTRTYRKAGVYFIRARVPRRVGYPIDIQVWDDDGGEVGYRYRGLTPRELRRVLGSESPDALALNLWQIGTKREPQ